MITQTNTFAIKTDIGRSSHLKIEFDESSFASASAHAVPGGGVGLSVLAADTDEVLVLISFDGD